MSKFFDEMRLQPAALRALAAAYQQPAARKLLLAHPPGGQPLFLGMGASHHAGLLAARYLQRAGIAALALEAADLLQPGNVWLQRAETVVFVSQSGASAEVQPVCAQLGATSALLAITNEPHSLLAHSAHTVLALHAGAEATVSSKTYVNSLALLWLLARAWQGRLDTAAFDELARVADHIEKMLEDCSSIAARWLAEVGSADWQVFVGQGAPAVTARQSAMMVNEWAKGHAIAHSVGSFRHGPVESADTRMGAVLFASPNEYQAMTARLATDLHGYGCRVLLVQGGEPFAPGQPLPAAAPFDEFLLPIIDTVAAQIYVDSLATAQHVAEGFRYISKVTAKL
jgi:fructoselysine-6-P-deglycase FrlB-like protein